MLRASSYTIYVDLPERSDEMLLVHGYTGSYDRVSRRVATFVRSLEASRAPKPLYGDWTPEPAPAAGAAEAPADETVRTLRRRGYLTEMTPGEEGDFFARFAERLHERSAQAMPKYIFMPTYQCNLRCAYCFQDHMRTDPRFAHLLRSMTPELVERVVAALPQIEALHGFPLEEGESGGPRHRDVGFFGGEPLLAANRPIVERIMTAVAAAGTASFWAVSNATDLDAYEDLLGPGQIASVQVTLDGPPREHDTRRIYADGSGSFERIARNITLALGKGAAISIRLNLDRNNIAQLPELAAAMIGRGWDRSPNFSVYTAPIRAENDKTDAKTTLSTWELDQAVAELRERHPEIALIARPDDGIKSRARQLFDSGAAIGPTFRESFCSAHTGMYIFDPFGDIYACWEKTGDAKIRSGHVAEDGRVEMSFPVDQMWRSRTVATNPVCRSCRYALHCGGGCAVLAIAHTGRYHANFCDGYANRFRAAIAEAYLEHEAGTAVRQDGGRVCDM